MKLISNTKFHQKTLYTANFMLPSLGGMPGLEVFDNFSPEAMQQQAGNLQELGGQVKQGVSSAAARAQEYLQKFGGGNSVPKPTGTSYHGTPLSPFQQFDRLPPNGGSRLAPASIPEPGFQLPFSRVPDPVQPYGIPMQRLPDSIGQPESAPGMLSKAKDFITGNTGRRIGEDVGLAAGGAALASGVRQRTQVGSIAENIEKAKRAMGGTSARDVGLAAGSAAALGAGGAYAANQFNVNTSYMADFGFKPLMPAKLGKVKLNLAKSGNLASDNSKLRKRANEALTTVKQAGRDSNTRMPMRGRTY